ncbi:MAG: C40 family peptidase [Deltaproteobacteria bacterium]|nr:C40 family peptidase [Deltaproteobacteria bacterium]
MLIPHKMLDRRFLLFLLLVAFLFPSCATTSYVPPEPYYPPVVEKKLRQLGYTIQAGAFSKVENAARFTERLNENNLNAYYFIYKTGLYKVRFGNFPSIDDARKEAEKLKYEGIIDDFYIVRPDEYSVSKKDVYGEDYLREKIVKTANGFRGVPYRWGGSSIERGVDCSGLAMAVYQLNGLDLPRTSLEQYRRGVFKDRNNLTEGDLVFFDTEGRGSISHVGIYVGGGRFIHAPGRGKKVREDRLSNKYYRERYAGAKSYM